MKYFASMCLAIVVLTAPLAAAVTPPANAEDRLASEDAIRKSKPSRARSGEELSPRGLLSWLEKVYRVPICFESAFVDSDRVDGNLAPLPMEPIAGESLREALDRFCSASEGRFVWRRNHGVICVESSSAAGRVENNLDTIISLELSGVSTWEAFQALAKAVNAARTTDRRFTANPGFLMSGRKDPPGFRTGSEITLRLIDVPARDAVCQIIASSPLGMQYVYWNFYRPERAPNSTPQSRITLSAFVDGKRYWVNKTLTGPEYKLYQEEIEAMTAKH